ncbi:MAG: glycosyltransferase [Proteobacteria bacterium]|nr:glycosyltransferase [Pseudomonadota bacterium]
MRLSAALIVRDEARFLEGCLASLRDRVDEIVVVDTGSTDSSIAIARAHGARVETHAWRGDFAAARNAAIDAASGDWILYIDADERVVAFDRDPLAAQATDPRVVACTVLFRPRTGYTRYRELRLFRKHAAIRFHGAIHETLVPALDALCAGGAHRIADSEVALDHLGYDGDLAHKHRRNLPLLEARLAREPGHVYCLDQLGVTREALGDAAGAEAAYREAIAALRATGSTRLAESAPYLHLAHLLRAQQRDADAVIDEGRTRYPGHHALDWLRAASFVEQRRDAEAIPLLQALAAIDAATLPAAGLAFDASIFGAQAHAALGLCYGRLGRLAESAAHYARARDLAPDDLEIRAKHAVAALRATRARPG